MNVESVHLVALAMGIFMKIVCFIIGYLIIRMGYDLISSGVKGEFKFSTKFGGVKADLASISPGLLFVLLGTLLIGFALFVEKEATYYKQSTPVVEKPKPIMPPKVELPSQDIKEGKSNEEKK